jgi:hypothetical protein
MKLILLTVLIGMSAELGCWRSVKWDDDGTDMETDRSTAGDIDGDTEAAVDADTDTDTGSISTDEISGLSSVSTQWIHACSLINGSVQC